MTNMMRKMVRIFMPLFVIGIHNCRQSFIREIAYSGNKENEVVGDNFPYIAMHSARID